PASASLGTPKTNNAFASLRKIFVTCSGLRPRSKGALPPSALRLPPPRSPRGRGAWRAGFALLHAPYHQALVATASIKGTASPEMLTRSVLGLRPCAPRAASAFALDTVLRSKLFERKGGQVTVE